MSNSGTTGRIPLWLVGMVVGIAVIGIVSIYLNRKRTLQEKFDFPSNRKGKLIALSRIEVQENQLKGCRNQERFLLSGLIYSFFMFQAVVLMGLNAKSIYFQEEKKIFSNSISREMNFETRVEKTRQMDPNLKLAAAPLANTALPNELNNPPPDAAANQLMNDPSPDADPDGLNGPSPAGHGLRARRPRGPNPFDKVRVQERNNPSNRPNGPTA